MADMLQTLKGFSASASRSSKKIQNIHGSRDFSPSINKQHVNIWALTLLMKELPCGFLLGDQAAGIETKVIVTVVDGMEWQPRVPLQCFRNTEIESVHM